MAEMSTAAAATSLAIFAFGFISGLTKSTMASTAVLKSSITITKEIVKRRIVHSAKLNPKISARIRTVIANKVCTLKLGSLRNANFNPSSANLKLVETGFFLLTLI